ncbi:MAG TPA: squalene/phytoene synthase family protein [Solirubrobacteraceae bacterium]|nr:squalene/phytoene synthase family protein [Solirubrobacteraceae bacterium]
MTSAAAAADGSTFAPGLQLLPTTLRADVHALYRVLRTLDDLVDEDRPEAAQRVEAVERWARGLRADTPETRTLADLTGRYPISPQQLLAFCDGMRHDIARASIETEEDLAVYRQQAGGSVGIVLAQILGTSHPDGERKMATLGHAMQWTNILRDIDEDLAHGRVYIAQTTIERFGFPHPGAREELLRDQIGRADALYEDGLGAIALLRSGRRAMGLATALYREILRQLERDGFGRKPGRAVVPASRQRQLAAEYRTRTGDSARAKAPRRA